MRKNARTYLANMRTFHSHSDALNYLLERVKREQSKATNLFSVIDFFERLIVTHEGLGVVIVCIYSSSDGIKIIGLIYRGQ
jgi:hypothetical protein